MRGTPLTPTCNTGLIVGRSSPNGKSPRQPTSTPKRSHRRPPVEFYDLANDPEETRNLASDPNYASEMKTMAKQLDDWMNENGDNVRMQNEPYPLRKRYPGPQQ